jgi:FtsZ-binding cell division protein ZapB
LFACALLATGLPLPAQSGAGAPDRAAAQARTAEQVDGALAVLDKWVENRRLIEKEKRDWALGRELLRERIDLIQREIEGLRARIAEADQSIAEADRKRAELLAENEHLKSGTAALGEQAQQFEAGLRALLPRLPEPLLARVQMLSQRLPAPPAEPAKDGAPPAKVPELGDRWLTIVGLLNECDKFQREIVQTSEVRKLGDGTSAEVTTIYLGLARAYYVTADRRAAGVGRPTADGWVWTPLNDAGPAIADAIAIFENKQVARYVPLPVRVE